MLCGVGTNWFDINVEYGQARLDRIIVESRLQNRRKGEVAMLDGRLQTRRIYRVSQARLGRACSTTLCTMPAWRMIMVWSGKELFVIARLTQRTVDTVSSPPQEGGEQRFLGKENLYQRRKLMVWFSIFASLTLSSFWPHNGQECEVWQNLVDSFLNLLGLLLLSQGWTYLKLLYELSSETKLGSLEWAPKRLLPNISLSYLYFSTILYTFLFCLYFSTFVFLFLSWNGETCWKYGEGAWARLSKNGGRPHSHSQHHGIMRCSGTYCLLFVILSIAFTFKVRLQQHSILTALVLVQNFTGNVH